MAPDHSYMYNEGTTRAGNRREMEKWFQGSTVENSNTQVLHSTRKGGDSEVGVGRGWAPVCPVSPGTPRGRAGLHAPNTLQRNTQNKTGEQSWGQWREPRVVGKMESHFALHRDVVALDWTPNRREGRTQRMERDKEYFLKRHGALIKIIIP